MTVQIPLKDIDVTYAGKWDVMMDGGHVPGQTGPNLISLARMSSRNPDKELEVTYDSGYGIWNLKIELTPGFPFKSQIPGGDHAWKIFPEDLLLQEIGL